MLLDERRLRKLCVLGWAMLLLSPVAAADDGSQKHEFLQIRMGVPVSIQVYAADGALANQAADAAYDRLRELDRMLSDYDPDSELMRVVSSYGPGEPFAVSPELLFVLQQALELSQRTDGAFDVTVGPMVKLWRRARRRGELPSEEQLTAALQSVGHKHLCIDAEAGTVTLLRTDMQIDLGGIAKGYAADEALRVLKQHGLTQVLVDAGGDIVTGDPPPGRNGWRIVVEPLEADDGDVQSLELSHAAAATSGDAYQYVEIDGTRYSHIVDPTTGLGLTKRSSVTVVAPTGIVADGLASAVSVLGPQRGLELIEETPGAEALIVTVHDGEIERVQSSGFAGLLSHVSQQRSATWTHGLTQP